MDEEEWVTGWGVISRTGEVLEFGFYTEDLALRWADGLGLENYTVEHAYGRDEYEDLGE